jgi:hypothetical protein
MLPGNRPDAHPFLMIVSDKRIAANRANAAKSTGPKTAEGKSRSSRNATRHGLLANIVAVRNENKEAFDHAVRVYVHRFQPTDDVEYAMIEQLVAATWRLTRSLAIEKAMFDTELAAHPNAPTEADRLALAFGDLTVTPKLTTLYRYQTRLQLNQSRIIRDLINLRKSVPPPEEPLPDPDPEPVPITSPIPNKATNPRPIIKIAEPNEPIFPSQTHSEIQLCDPLDPETLE